MCTARVTAIIVTFNPEILSFRKVIDSIHSQVSSTILVDNGSSNATDIINLISTIPNIHPLFNEENIGLASAQNLAIRHIIESNMTDYVIFFDQDSVLNDGFISNLLETHISLRNSGEQVAAVGPSFIDPSNNKEYPATVYHGPFIKRVALSNKPVEATFIIASGCLVELETLKVIGNMKDELFIDYIDVEWCLRAKSMGYKVFIAPNAKMRHTIGDNRITILGRTISVHSPLRRYYLVRNSFFMVRLPYVPLGYKIREIIFNGLRTIISVLTSQHKMKVVSYTLQAVKDGLIKKFGPYDRVI